MTTKIYPSKKNKAYVPRFTESGSLNSAFVASEKKQSELTKSFDFSDSFSSLQEKENWLKDRENAKWNSISW